MTTGTLAQLIDRLDQDERKRGVQFERIVKWYLEHDPVYRHDLQHVWLWEDWPGRWGPDAGIDLVAQASDGALWAVQAKAYHPDYSITKHDVDTFLSESARKQFAYRLLVATTDRIGRTARRTLEGQEKPAGLRLRSDLEAAQLCWPISPNSLRARAAPRKRPRPHQSEALKAVSGGFRAHDRGQMIMACGTGKTLAALFITERLRAQRTLVLVPSLSLLAQTLREWTANARVPFNFLPVCSDDTVADPDAPVSTTSELGFPVTTDPVDIAAFLRKRGPAVVFSTYQSSSRVAEAFALGRVPHFDLAIADEAHRCAGPASSEFATILDSELIRAHRRLFMTATPRYFTGRLIREAKEAAWELASMDDEAQFGPVFHRLSFGEAIDRELLSDYQVAIIGVDDDTYRSWAEHGELLTLDGHAVTDAREVGAQIGLAKAIRRYDLHRIISFHSRVAHARSFSRELPAVIDWMPARQRPRSDGLCDYVTGEMTAGERNRRLGRLRDVEREQWGLLSNARCLGEGVDVPTLDGVAFIDPRRSEVDIVQAIGRAIRKAETKTVGTIVLPVFIAGTEDPELALEGSAFKPVWDVIKALRAHDADLGEHLDALRQQLGRGNRRTMRLPSKIKVDLPRRVGSAFARAFDVQLVEHTTASWEFWFGILQRFVAEQGHALVPQTEERDGYALGTWVGTQRAFAKQGRLHADRCARLERLPGWSWDAREESWERAIAALTAFQAREGHTQPPRGHIEDGFGLGAWIPVQRNRFNQGRLPPDRAAALEAVTGWSWSPFGDSWSKNYSLLLRYVAREGTARVSTEHREGSFALGRWTRKQRRSRVEGKLSIDRVEKLEALPDWVWDVDAASWDDAFESLQRFVGDTGTARVPVAFIDRDGIRLGEWARNQRSLRRTGRLIDERAARLDSLPGWSWGRTTANAERMALTSLRSYVDRQGNALVPRRHVEGEFQLGQWVANQRGKHRRGELAENRVAILEKMPGWSWSGTEAKWELSFQHLEEFVAANGHAAVTRRFVAADGHHLGEWVTDQRAKRRGGTLSKPQIKALERLPGWAWEARHGRRAAK